MATAPRPSLPLLLTALLAWSLPACAPPQPLADDDDADDDVGDDDVGVDDDVTDVDDVTDDDDSADDDDSGPPPVCELVISEVLPTAAYDVNGDGPEDNHDGYVEMVALGPDDCELGGMAVVIGTQEYLRHVFVNGTVLQPGQFLLLVDDGYGAAFEGALPGGAQGLVVEANQGADITSGLGDDSGLVKVTVSESDATLVAWMQYERVDEDYGDHAFTRLPELDGEGEVVGHLYHPCSDGTGYSLATCADGSGFAGGCTCTTPRATPGDLVINEVLGNTSSMVDFVEVVNVSGHDVSLGGVAFFRNASQEKGTFTSAVVLGTGASDRGAVMVGPSDVVTMQGLVPYPDAVVGGRTSLLISDGPETVQLLLDQAEVLDQASYDDYGDDVCNEADPVCAYGGSMVEASCTPGDWGC